jgi:hypothetical protein
VDSKAIFISIIVAPVTVAVIGIIPPLKNAIPFDGLLVGIALSLVICLFGFVKRKNETNGNNSIS